MTTIKPHSSAIRSGFTLVEIMIVVAIIGLLATIAIPNFMRAHQQSLQNTCIDNMRLLEAAWHQAAMEHKWQDTSPLNPDDLIPYLKGNALPTCPAQGVYTYTPPALVFCNITGHKLPPP